jgi:hypothetical protein
LLADAFSATTGAAAAEAAGTATFFSAFNSSLACSCRAFFTTSTIPSYTYAN